MRHRVLTVVAVLLLAGAAIVLASDPCDTPAPGGAGGAGSGGEPAPGPVPEVIPEVIEVDPGEDDLGTAWQRAFFEAMAAAIADGGLAPPDAALEPSAPPLPPLPAEPVALRQQEPDAGRRLTIARRPGDDGDPAAPASAARRREPEPPPPPEPERGASFDKDSVKAAVNAIKPGVRECYKQGLRQDPYLAGEVYIRFNVRRDGDEGRITDAEFLDDQTTMADVIVQACILEALSRARFPPPQGESQRVTYPFQFRKIPRKGPQAPAPP